MRLTVTPKRKNEYMATYRYRQIEKSSGICASTALICIRGTRFGCGFVPTMTVADVSTLPEYRNRGLVREMLETAHKKAREYGAYIALLHPFSFDFYRKFGYEKVSDSVSATLALSVLNAFSAHTSLVPLDEKYYGDLLTLFRVFSQNRNLMFDRYNIASFLKKKEEVYVFVYHETLHGYISIKKDTEQKSITVTEMAFSSLDSLTSLLAHLKGYANDFETVCFADVEPIPELYSLFKGLDVTYESRGDLAARILDTEGLLSAIDYPIKHGEFTLRVIDTFPDVAGIFKVTYENNKGIVERLPDSVVADVTASAPVLLRRIYGCDESCEGFILHGDASDLFRAFPKRINGLFEHF